MSVIKLSFALLVVLFSMNLALASFEVGNVSNGLNDVYGAGKPISGWINLSVVSEASDSVLSAFDGSVSLIDLLKNNSVNYDCSPLDCSVSYSIVGNEKNSEEFSIDFGDKEVIGVKVVGSINEITGLSFDVSSDAGISCVNPLQIDILEDGLVEWKYENIGEDYCNSEKPFGCFDSTSVKEINVTEDVFCEQIVVPPTKAVKIGAVLSAIKEVPESASFLFSLDGEDCAESVVVTESGEMGCVVILEEALTGFSEVEVCIRAKEGLGSENKYKIRYDNYEDLTCGFRIKEDGEKEFFDFEIFAKPLKYSAINVPFEFGESLIGEESESSMNEDILNYLSEKYFNCSSGCIVPISFISGINQKVSISNLVLSYGTVDDLNSDSATGFYELNSSSPFLTFEFEKLELSGLNLLTPSSLGKETLYLKLNDEEILEKEIVIRNIPEINNVFPKSPASLVPTTFIATLENKTGNLTYVWDFGDNSSVQTSSTEFIKHTYSQIGSYDLTLTIKGNFGESSKTFNINVVAPSEAINQTIIDYKANLKNLKKQINALPLMIKIEVEKVIDLVELEKIVDKKEEEFKDALSDEEFVDLMKELLVLKVPEEIGQGFVIEEGEFFQNPDEIKLENFEILEAGDVVEENEDYFNAMNNWIRENLDATVESKNYVMNYKNLPSESLFSYIKLKLKPLKEIDDLYVVINGNPAKIIFSDDFKDKDLEEFGRGIIFRDMVADETIVVEIIHPNAISIDNFPVYLSPDFNELELSVTIGVCNNNGKCESGENSENCKNDCKPWKFMMVLLIILFVVGFIVYIILQEWYKKNYESHLFKNKNQLFNLINFMSVSEIQGSSKGEIFKKLKEQGWKAEQMVYAWKKYKGKRTGMFEIPIFRVFEKRKLKRELAKRRDIGSGGSKGVGGVGGVLGGRKVGLKGSPVGWKKKIFGGGRKPFGNGNKQNMRDSSKRF